MSKVGNTVVDVKEEIARLGASDALERISQRLDSDIAKTSKTSMRIPAALREAATLAARELKAAPSAAAPSAAALVTMALRSALETAVMRVALDQHYAQYPVARPDLAEYRHSYRGARREPASGGSGRIRRRPKRL